MCVENREVEEDGGEWMERLYERKSQRGITVLKI